MQEEISISEQATGYLFDKILDLILHKTISSDSRSSLKIMDIKTYQNEGSDYFPITISTPPPPNAVAIGSRINPGNTPSTMIRITNTAIPVAGAIF